MAAIQIGETPDAVIYQREDGSQFKIPKQALGLSPSMNPLAQPPVPTSQPEGVEPGGAVMPPVEPVAPPGPPQPPGQVQPKGLDSQIVDANPQLKSEEVVVPEKTVNPNRIDVENYQPTAPSEAPKGKENYVQRTERNQRDLEANAQRVGELEKQREQEKQDIYQRGLAEQKKLDKENKAWDTGKQIELKGEEGELKAYRKKYEEAEVDPNRFWDNKSTGAKIGVFIAGALQGMADAVLGRESGGNSVANILERFIDRDIDAQQKNIDKMGRVLQGKESAYQWHYNVYRDDKLARAATKAQAWTDIEREALIKGQQYEGPLAAERTNNLVLTAREKKSEALQQFEDRQRQLAQQDRQISISAANAAEQKRHNQAMENLSKEQAAAKGGPDSKKAIRDTRGNIIGYATTDQDAEKANTVVSGRAKMAELKGEGERLFKDGWAMEGTELRAQQKAWVANWAAARKQAAGDTGKITDAEMSVYGIEDKWGPDYPLKEIEQGYNDARRQGVSILRQQGVSDDVLINNQFLEPSKMDPTKASQTGETDNPGNIFRQSMGEYFPGAVPVMNTETGAIEWYDQAGAQTLVTRYPDAYKTATAEAIKADRDRRNEEARKRKVQEEQRAANRGRTR